MNKTTKTTEEILSSSQNLRKKAQEVIHSADIKLNESKNRRTIPRYFEQAQTLMESENTNPVFKEQMTKIINSVQSEVNNKLKQRPHKRSPRQHMRLGV